MATVIVRKDVRMGELADLHGDHRTMPSSKEYPMTTAACMAVDEAVGSGVTVARWRDLADWVTVSHRRVTMS